MIENYVKAYPGARSAEIRSFLGPTFAISIINHRLQNLRNAGLLERRGKNPKAARWYPKE